MRTRLIALAALLGIATLITAPIAGAGTTSSTSGGSSSGGSHGGGGGGGGHGGGGSAGGGHGVGGFGGGHFGGGHFVVNGSSRSGFAGATTSASYMTRGGYVAHGSYMGQRGYIAHGDYRVVGSQSAGLTRVGAALPGARAGQITLALGPARGSAARALRLDRMDGMTAMHSARAHEPGHSHQPKRPHHHGYFPERNYETTQNVPPPFCDFYVPKTVWSPRDEMAFGCPGAIRTPIKARVGLLNP